jgi:hypothetical protein
MSNLTVIRPETVAAKLAAAANLSQPELAAELAKQPRLVELLWFLQWQSMQPGGLEKFALALIVEFPGRVGPAALVSAGTGKLTQKQYLDIWRAIPTGYWPDILPNNAWQMEALRNDMDVDRRYYLSEKVLPQEQSRLAAALAKLNRQAFVEVATAAAETDLAAYLASLCNDVDGSGRNYEAGKTGDPLSNAPWYSSDIIPTLFAAMDSHAQRARQAIAMTEVALKVFDALEYAWSERALVQITGDSRFGKTEAVKTWCMMHPGKARLVTVLCTVGASDLHRAVADALGIEYSYKTARLKLREIVEFTVKHSGLMFIFDEAHFLFPAASYKNSPPMRLNWLRTQVVDRKLPVALVSTPQDYDHAAAKFVKASGFNLAQWTGRIVHQTILPGELEFDDLLAIAKIKCPELDGIFQELIAAKALQSENYIMAVEAIGKRARYIARRDGHPETTQADVTLAISEFIPASAPAPAAAKPAPAAAPSPAPIRQATCSSVSAERRQIAPGFRSIDPAAPPPVPALATPQRQITPALVAA